MQLKPLIGLKACETQQDIAVHQRVLSRVEETQLIWLFDCICLYFIEQYQKYEFCEYWNYNCNI